MAYLHLMKSVKICSANFVTQSSIWRLQYAPFKIACNIKKRKKIYVRITARSAITNSQLHNELHLLKYFLFSFPFNTLEIRLKASALLPVKEIHQLQTIPGKWTQVNIMSTSNKPVLPLITIIFSFYRQQNLLTVNAAWDRIFCQCYKNCQRSIEQFCFFNNRQIKYVSNVSQVCFLKGENLWSMQCLSPVETQCIHVFCEQTDIMISWYMHKSKRPFSRRMGSKAEFF